MQHTGYSLIDANGTEVKAFGAVKGVTQGIPDLIVLPNGDRVHAPSLGVVYGDCKLVERWMGNGPSGISFDGTKVLETQPVTEAEIIAERERRLALGFNYNFGDARGVHRIGTTKRDLEGWDEVSKYAGALIDAGQTSTTINIATDTGPCTVTPIEWRAIEIASAAFRQPLWAASFALMAMNPIPADYANDSYWTP